MKVAMTGRGSFLEIPLDPTQARDNRNGLVKHVYGQARQAPLRLVGSENAVVFETRAAEVVVS